MRTVTACLLACFLVGCASRSPAPPARAGAAPLETTAAPGRESLASRFARVHIGDRKEDVERLLGQPYSTEETAASSSAVYMSGMEELMAQVRRAQRSATGTSFVSGALNSALGLAALAGPAGSIAAGVGGQVVSLAGSAANDIERPSFDPSSIEVLMIEYRDGKVYAIRRQGGMGQPMAQDQDGRGDGRGADASTPDSNETAERAR